MAVELRADLGRKLISDPVEAAYVLMGAELDDFQAARFRHWWFCPTVMDHSGVSVGKSEMAFLFVFLRLMLLPLPHPRKPRIVTVYYQSQGTAEEVFLPKLDEYMHKGPIFEKQIKRQHGGKFYKEKRNVIVIEMRDGGWCELPAGDFMKDSQNQASKRFNDLIIDEGAMIDQLGRGIDKQLLQRNTRECFNDNHPVHANHTVFLGHAESPDHVYHRRYAAIRRLIRKKGSQDHAVITSSYLDYTGEHKRRYGQTVAKRAADHAQEMDPAEFAQIYYGLWKRGSRGLYSPTLRKSLQRKELRAHLRREDAETIYYLGWDTATGLSAGNDWSAGVVFAAKPLASQVHGPEPGFMRVGDRVYHVQAVYAVFLPPGADVDQKSGVIHLLHQWFGFSGICLDNRGGGGEVSQKLRESRQFICNEWREVTGLCRPEEMYAWPLAQPIVALYDRGEPLLRPWFGARFVGDNTGPIDYAHREVRGMMRRGEIAWTPALEDFLPQELQAMEPEQVDALRELEKALDQFGNIGVKVDKANLPVLSERGFQKFVSTGKKDGAMAGIYGVLGLRATLARLGGVQANPSGAPLMGVFSS